MPRPRTQRAHIPSRLDRTDSARHAGGRPANALPREQSFLMRHRVALLLCMIVIVVFLGVVLLGTE